MQRLRLRRRFPAVVAAVVLLAATVGFGLYRSTWVRAFSGETPCGQPEHAAGKQNAAAPAAATAPPPSTAASAAGYMGPAQFAQGPAVSATPRPASELTEQERQQLADRWRYIHDQPSIVVPTVPAGPASAAAACAATAIPQQPVPGPATVSR